MAAAEDTAKVGRRRMVVLIPLVGFLGLALLFVVRLYSGDPEINAQRWFRSGITRDCEQLVHELLKP